MIAPIAAPSPNHNARAPGTRVELLILHYTGMISAEAALARLVDPAAEVSAHYTVLEDGRVFAHVPEERRAWHAGAGIWRGAGDLNSRSVGVEIVNPGHEFGYRPFPAAQMAAVAELAKGVLARHTIPPDGVLGHSDVAPGRKRDPGELFDWPGLAAQGIGSWPTPNPRDQGVFTPKEVEALLGRLGYDHECGQAILAFQRHFHPEGLSGQPDDETVRRMRALARLWNR